MKITSLILGCVLALFTTVAVVANEPVKEISMTALELNDQAKEISVDQLPDAVATAWEEKKSDMDEVSKVYEVTSADGTVYYRIEYSDGTEMKTVEFDADGNEIA